MASKMSRNRFNSFYIAGFLYLEMLTRSNVNVRHPISGQNSFVTNRVLIWLKYFRIIFVYCISLSYVNANCQKINFKPIAPV